MATRRAPRPAEEPDDPPDPLDDDGPVNEESDDLDMIMEQLTGEAEYIVLWRTDGTTGKQEHVDKVALSRFSAEYVKERHGGGDYIFRAYGAKLKGGRRRVQKYKEFSIDKSLAPKSGSAAAVWKERMPAESRGGDVEPRRGMPAWLETTLAASVPVLIAGVVAALTKEKTADPLLIELIKTRNTGGSTDPVALQALLADERARAIELGKEMGRGGRRRGGGDDDDEDDRDPTIRLISDGITTLSEFAQGYRTNAETEAKKAAAETGSGGATGSDGLLPAHPRDSAVDRLEGNGNRAEASTGAETTPGAGSAVRPWVEAASPYMGMLKLAKGMSPATAAALISENLDDEQFSDLMADIEDVTDGGILPRLAGYFPSLGNVNIEWFRAVIDEIAATADPIDEPATAPPDTPHDNGSEGTTAST